MCSIEYYYSITIIVLQVECKYLYYYSITIRNTILFFIFNSIEHTIKKAYDAEHGIIALRDYYWALNPVPPQQMSRVLTR